MGVRHGDIVKVMSGRSKGKTGKVLSVNPPKHTITVEHVNIIKKHTRPNPSKNVRGGILEKEGPIQVSNVMLVCPGCGKHTRAGHSSLPDGTKVRVCRRCNTTFES
jgi:large subunit ribosomal protein L24